MPQRNTIQLSNVWQSLGTIQLILRPLSSMETSSCVPLSTARRSYTPNGTVHSLSLILATKTTINLPQPTVTSSKTLSMSNGCANWIKTNGSNTLAISGKLLVD